MTASQDSPTDAPATPGVPTSARLPAGAWLVRAATLTKVDSVGPVSLVSDFLDGGFAAIGWAHVGAFAPGSDAAEISAAVRREYEGTPGSLRATAGNLNRFINRIKVGHFVVTVHKSDVYLGQVVGPYSFDADRPLATARRWSVKWFNADAPVHRKAIKASHLGLYNKLRSHLTVTDLTDEVPAIAALVGLAPSPSSFLITPLPSATTCRAPKTHIIRGSGTRITVVSVDLEAEPTEILGQIDDLAHLVAQNVTTPPVPTAV